MAEVIRPSLPDPNAAQPRRSLVARVFDALRRPDVKVESYRLKKALLNDDRDAIVKSARNLTGAERLAVLEEVEEIRKGYWDPEKRNYSALNPRPPQVREPAAPKRPPLQLAPQIGTGFRHEIRRGAIVHFDIDGQRYHGKVLRWGARGAEVVTATGDIAAVTWEAMKFGVAPESAVEHVLKSIPEPALYQMSPEERVEFFRLRGDQF